MLYGTGSLVKARGRKWVVLPSTVTRLERCIAVGQPLFDLYSYVTISTAYIKSGRRRDEFVRVCLELMLVDEAHTCAFSPDQRGGCHLRHQMVRQLAVDPRRHLILVTAIPHSGDEGAFRSLLGLLRPQFLDLPDDMTGRHNERHRRAHPLLPHRYVACPIASSSQCAIHRAEAKGARHPLLPT